MNGQWIGTYAGSNTGNVIVNVDERELGYDGFAYLINVDETVPIYGVRFRTEGKTAPCRFRTSSIIGIDRKSNMGIPLEELTQKYPPGTVPKYADVSSTWDKDWLTISWTTDAGEAGNCVLPRSKAGQPSELVPLKQNWGEFKNYVASLKGSRYLFRGQNGQWRLRTSFHRHGRADVARFVFEDIPVLHRHLSARTRHVFNLQNPDENGAFLNMVQHHGYPTPLLDWTYSPYVGAFFAFRGITSQKAATASQDENVRVLVFDPQQWKSDWEQILFLSGPKLHLSIAEFIAIENERLIPQQAASMVTNIDDIETYIGRKESQSHKQYLWAIDLPIQERTLAVRDLRYMGITAGSLFPGLDGACEELTERNFET